MKLRYSKITALFVAATLFLLPGTSSISHASEDTVVPLETDLSISPEAEIQPSTGMELSSEAFLPSDSEEPINLPEDPEDDNSEEAEVPEDSAVQPVNDPGTDSPQEPADDPDTDSQPQPEEVPGAGTPQEPVDEPGTDSQPLPEEVPGADSPQEPLDDPDPDSQPQPEEVPGADSPQEPVDDPATDGTEQPEDTAVTESPEDQELEDSKRDELETDVIHLETDLAEEPDIWIEDDPETAEPESEQPAASPSETEAQSGTQTPETQPPAPQPVQPSETAPSASPAGTETEKGTEKAAAPASEAGTEKITEAETEAEASVYYPWLNSNIYGNVTADLKIDRKDDFYTAVNQEWLANVEFIPGYPAASSFVTLTDDISQKLMALMTDDSLTSHDALLLQNVYELFLDWDTRNELGVEPLLPHVQAITDISSLDELTEYLISEDGLLYGGGLWEISIGYNAEDSSRYELDIYPISLSLGDPAEYEQLTPNGELTLRSYREIASWMLSKVGFDEHRIQELLDLSYSFEEKLAPSIMTVLESSSPDAVQKMINPVTFEELEQASPHYPLPRILEAFNSADWELMNLTEPAFLEKMDELYTEENLEAIKAYMLINFVSSYASMIDEETFREMQRIRNERTGISQNPPDEMYAYSAASSLLPTSISKVFVERYVSEQTREDIRGIIQKIIDTYRVMLEEEDWLSSETREKAVSKLDHITTNAAYPDKWEETDSIQFPGKDEGGTLFTVQEELIRYNIEQFQKKKNSTVDPEIWNFGVTDVNAYYSPMDNSINIIAGILDEPFYSETMSVEEKLGGIGMIIGHEISHAFDPTGSQFDETGNFVNWWKPEDYAAFSERAQKLIDYYNQIVPMEGVSYSGDMVQGEAVADMGGMKCMLRIARDIEGFDYEKFFTSFAKVWKSCSTPEMVQYQISLDPHPLEYLRINITCMQFPEFRETFDIQEGDGMYLAPEDRINVW